MADNIIGILGGMGPLATVNLFQRIVELTDADRDCEHIHIIIDNNSTIPDRTKAILQNGDNPVPAMVRSAKFLEASGSNLIVMPCNTAHFFLPEVQKEIHVPILNMISCTAQTISEMRLDAVGLLATDGTCRSNLYHDALAAYQIQTVTPHALHQNYIMDTIYRGVKGNNAAYISYPRLNEIMEEMAGRGAQAFILGCTELPVVFNGSWCRKLFLDPTSILARNAICIIGKKVREENICHN